MSNLLHGLIGDARAILVSFMILVAIFFVIATWVTTRALVPVIGALLFGALVVFGVANSTFLANRAGEDVNRNRSNTGQVGSDVTVLQP